MKISGQIPRNIQHAKIISLKKKKGNLNKSINSEIIESEVKKFLANKSSEPDDFTGEFWQAFKELISLLLKDL